MATIAQGIDKSDRTVRRVLKRLETLRIIRRITKLRPKSGGVGANIIQILPFVSEPMSELEVDEKAGGSKGEPNDPDNEPLHKRFKNNYVLESASIPNNIPRPLYEILSPFFSGEELRKYVGIIFRAKHRKYATVRVEHHSEEFKACIADCIRRFKLGEVRKLDGYLYESIRNLSRRLFLAESFEEVYA
ncbi:hypothetical protein [Oceanobacillus kimchii]|uniref:hypothetical protein n=1 Tax=Oceanobacillus kimchii TaxID=746691 RepID=UPI003B018536